MDTHVRVLLVTLERDVELILMSALQLLVSMETALYVILNLLISDLLLFFIQDLINGYQCSCDNGWSGENCGANIDDCTPNPCQHGGQCTVSECQSIQ